MVWATANAQVIIAVVDLESKTGVSGEIIRTICDGVSREIAKDTSYVVFDREYLPTLISQVNKKIAGPCARARCMSDLGKAIGANQIVGGFADLTNGVMDLEFKRVDVKTGKVISTIRRRIAGPSEDKINQRLPQIARDLLTTTDEIIADKENKRGVKKPLIWIGASSIVAAGVVAAIYLLPLGDSGDDGEVPLDNVPQHVR